MDQPARSAGPRDGWQLVSTEEALRDVVGVPVPRVAAKVRSRLDAVDRLFLAASPLWFVGTASPDGRCEVSPKGDPPGSVLVLDETTVVLADRPGNRRVDGFLDVLVNPHVGVLFLVPGRGDTLRVNGRATLVRDAPFFRDLEVQGRRPALALVVDVEEVFFHCSKAFLRSRAWEPASWQPDAVPSRAQIAHAQERCDEPLEVVEAYYQASSYGKDLY